MYIYETVVAFCTLTAYRFCVLVSQLLTTSVVMNAFPFYKYVEVPCLGSSFVIFLYLFTITNLAEFLDLLLILTTTNIACIC